MAVASSSRQGKLPERSPLSPPIPPARLAPPASSFAAPVPPPFGTAPFWTQGARPALISTEKKSHWSDFLYVLYLVAIVVFGLALLAGLSFLGAYGIGVFQEQNKMPRPSGSYDPTWDVTRYILWFLVAVGWFFAAFAIVSFVCRWFSRVRYSYHRSRKPMDVEIGPAPSRLPPRS